MSTNAANAHYTENENFTAVFQTSWLHLTLVKSETTEIYAPALSQLHWWLQKSFKK